MDYSDSERDLGWGGGGGRVQIPVFAKRAHLQVEFHSMASQVLVIQADTQAHMQRARA